MGARTERDELGLTTHPRSRQYRYEGQRYTTVMVRSPRSFVDNTLWPEFLELQTALHSYLNEATERIIREGFQRRGRSGGTGGITVTRRDRDASIKLRPRECTRKGLLSNTSGAGLCVVVVMRSMVWK